jgi:lipopolysaccharide transport system permease protein
MSADSATGAEWRSVTASSPQHLLSLLRALVVREIKGQYRRSVLGPAWAVLQPLIYMIIFSFFRGFLNIDSEGIPYAVFTFSALVPWTFFANAVTRSAPSVFVNRGVVKKIAVRCEIFPATAVLTSLVDFAISFVILAGLMVWFGIVPTWTVLWIVPLVALTATFALGLGLLTAAIGTYRQDVMFGIPFLLQLGLLATPVMYPASQVPEKWQAFVWLNPMAGIIEGFRGALLSGTAPDPMQLGASVVGVALVWAVAWPLFRYLSKFFADVL